MFTKQFVVNMWKFRKCFSSMWFAVFVTFLTFLLVPGSSGQPLNSSLVNSTKDSKKPIVIVKTTETKTALSSLTEVSGESRKLAPHPNKNSSSHKNETEGLGVTGSPEDYVTVGEAVTVVVGASDNNSVTSDTTNVSNSMDSSKGQEISAQTSNPTNEKDCEDQFCSLLEYFPDGKELNAIQKNFKLGERRGKAERVKLDMYDDVLVIMRLDRAISFKLTPNTKLFSSRNRIEVSDGDSFDEMELLPDTNTEYYRGDSKDTNEFASLQHDENLKWKGTLVLNDGNFLLHPLPGDQPEDYVVYEFEREERNNPSVIKEMDRYLAREKELRKEKEREEDQVSAQKREKRSTHHKLSLDLAIYSDVHFFKKLRNTFDNDVETSKKIREIMSATVNTIHTYYQRRSLGKTIVVQISKMQIFTNNPDGMATSKDLDEYLRNFCNFDMTMNPNGKNWDYALLLSGLDMHTHGVKRALGVSYFRSVCKFPHRSSCAIGAGRGMDVGLTMAHEIGHSLGMPHDGQPYNKCNTSRYIMGSVVTQGQVDFSSCSREGLHSYLDMLDAFGHNCMRDVKYGEPTREFQGKFPGERRLPDQQCEYRHGEGFHADKRDPAFCRYLTCENNASRIDGAEAPLLGTPCGRGKICWHGSCQHRSKAVSSMEKQEREANSVAGVDEIPKPKTMRHLCEKYATKACGPYTYQDAVSYGYPNFEDVESTCSKGGLCFCPYNEHLLRLHLPPPDGTSCAEGRVCRNYECVTHEKFHQKYLEEMKHGDLSREHKRSGNGNNQKVSDIKYKKASSLEEGEQSTVTTDVENWTTTRKSKVHTESNEVTAGFRNETELEQFSTHPGNETGLDDFTSEENMTGVTAEVRNDTEAISSADSSGRQLTSSLPVVIFVSSVVAAVTSR